MERNTKKVILEGKKEYCGKLDLRQMDKNKEGNEGSCEKNITLQLLEQDM